MSPADFADFIRHLIGDLQLFTLCIGFRFLNLLAEFSIKITEQFLPLFGAVFHFIKLFLHTAGKAQINNIMEMLPEVTGHNLAKRSRLEITALFCYIIMGSNRRHR